jgi:hypothetical protein
MWFLNIIDPIEYQSLFIISFKEQRGNPSYFNPDAAIIDSMNVWASLSPLDSE